MISLKLFVVSSSVHRLSPNISHFSTYGIVQVALFFSFLSFSSSYSFVWSITPIIQNSILGAELHRSRTLTNCQCATVSRLRVKVLKSEKSLCSCSPQLPANRWRNCLFWPFNISSLTPYVWTKRVLVSIEQCASTQQKKLQGLIWMLFFVTESWWSRLRCTRKSVKPSYKKIRK